jgi:hypothetical protein
MRSAVNPPAIILHAVLFLFSPGAAIALASVTIPLALIVWALAPVQWRVR